MLTVKMSAACDASAISRSFARSEVPFSFSNVREFGPFLKTNKLFTDTHAELTVVIVSLN